MIPHLWPFSFSFGVPDAIDIVATSVLIYYLLLLIRGTRAVQIMLGLLTLVIVLALSNLLHLLVLTTVMQYLLLGTAVTLPIVFQPELRRILEQIGRGRGDERVDGLLAHSALRVLDHDLLRAERVAPHVVVPPGVRRLHRRPVPVRADSAHRGVPVPLPEERTRRDTDDASNVL